MLIQELIYGDKKLFWKDWNNLLPTIFPMIIQENNKIIKFDVNIYLTDLISKIELLYQDRLYLKDEYNKIIPNLLKLLNKYNTSCVNNLYKLFVHGDLTPNNVISNNGNLKLIDFGNAGILNFSYDLMLQNFYFLETPTWTDFNTIEFKINTDKKVFFGSSKLFFNTIEDIHNIVLSEDEIKLGIIVALSELFLKCDIRYQSKTFYCSGVGMFNHIEIITNLIKNSNINKDKDVIYDD